MARLLVALKAWKQQVPEHLPVPDQSRATLMILCPGAATTIREPYHDLARLGRLVQVRGRLLDFVPDTLPP